MRYSMQVITLLLLLLTDSVVVRESLPSGFPIEPAVDHANTSFFPQQPDPSDLPLKLFETATETALPMLVYVSGDGGWNNFSAALCNYLNQKGIPVVALDAQKYFWKSKLPEETAKEMETVIGFYLKKWKREKYVMAGFSFGADIIPFIVNRLPAEMKAGLVASVLISPDRTCDFEIHLSDMLSLGISKGRYDVVREISAGNIKKLAILFGSDENKNNRSAFGATGAKIIVLQGNHHFDSAFETVGDSIISEIR